MTRPDLSRLSSEEKDRLILALLDRVAALEAKLGQPPKTPGNSSVPPSRGQKGNRPPREKKRPRRHREGPGVTRDRASDPDRVIDCRAEGCAHCGTTGGPGGQTLPGLSAPAARRPARRHAARFAVWLHDRVDAGLSAPPSCGCL